VRLRDRLDRIEQLMDRPRFSDGEGRPTLIKIVGGLPDDDRLHATVGNMRLVCEPDEAPDEFEDRVRSAAVAAGVEFAVIGGLKPWVR
jgi:hypothetical protein